MTALGEMLGVIVLEVNGRQTGRCQGRRSSALGRASPRCCSGARATCRHGARPTRSAAVAAAMSGATTLRPSPRRDRRESGPRRHVRVGEPRIPGPRDGRHATDVGSGETAPPAYPGIPRFLRGGSGAVPAPVSADDFRLRGPPRSRTPRRSRFWTTPPCYAASCDQATTPFALCRISVDPGSSRRVRVRGGGTPLRG